MTRSLPVVFLLACAALSAQQTGTLQGKVTLMVNGNPVHRATVTLGRTVGRTGLVTESAEDGTYTISGIAPGTYTVTAHLSALNDAARTVTIVAGGTETLDFSLGLEALKQSVNVTAGEREQLSYESFQSVSSIDSIDLALKAAPSLGEVLDNQPGVSKRSFGPGNSRPVIRGFDGDRVLVMQDGVPTGSLSSQSGDHGESVDASSLERLEVVKGPATLLYGSNAIGGVVNAVTSHNQAHDHPHQGGTGYLTGFGGSNNGQAGGAGGFSLGAGDWLLWGSGSAQRTGNYKTPLGTVDNSQTRVSNSAGGIGWFGKKRFVDFNQRYEEGAYGIPFAQEDGKDVSLDYRRNNTRLSTGWKDSDSFLQSFRLAINYTDWKHRELLGEDPATIFNNKMFTYRGVVSQRALGKLTGSFGFQGNWRDFKTTGAEVLSPPVTQTNYAVFGLEEYQLERVRFQFGGRAETTAFKPLGLENRYFAGASGAAGIFINLWKQGVFVTNVTSSSRAPSLEELYFNGPHAGQATYQIGNINLVNERSTGLDLSLRHNADKVRGELNYFYYGIRNFVYMSPTGAIEDGLPVANMRQGDSRFTGMEGSFDVSLHPNLWLNLGTDYVNAQLTATNMPLPRIPPLRGRVGLDWRYRSFNLRPEMRLSNAQNRVFVNETSTAGYAVFGLNGSYTHTGHHTTQVLGVEAFNLTDQLYRNHLSFIKAIAPEIGRGVRFTYTLRFF